MTRNSDALASSEGVQKLSDIRKAALDHGWRWFEYHANQRLMMFRFYLVIIGAAATAYFTAIKEQPAAATAAASFGLIASVLFWR